MNVSKLFVAGVAFSMSATAFAAGTHGGRYGTALRAVSPAKPQRSAEP